MNILDYISEHALVLLPVLWVLGTIIKKTPKIPDWLIPYILLIAGIVLTNALLGISVDSVIQGILVSGTSVLGHQLYKQGVEAKNEIKNK